MTVVPPTELFTAALGAHRRGEVSVAARLYAKVVTRDPGHAPAHFLIAMILRSGRRIEGAFKHARRAVLIAPDTASYRQGLAEVLLAGDRVEEAEQAFRMTALCDPTIAAAWAWLSGRLVQRGDLIAAERVARRSRCLSDDGQAATAHAEILGRLGDVETAWTIADRTVRRGGTYDALADLKSGLMLPPVPWDRAQIETARQRFADSLERVAQSGLRLADPVSQVGRVPFYLAFHGLDDRALVERFNDVLHAATPAFQDRRTTAGAPGGRTRVGLFSTFLNSHTVLLYTQGLIRAMAARPDLEVIALPTDAIPPAARRYLTSLGAAVAPVSRDYPRAAEQIRALALDTLVFADIGMEPLSCALAHSDLAPRQIALSGHPVTTGIRRLDGYVTCPIFEPENHRAHYTEPLIHARFWPLGYVRTEADGAPLPKPDRDWSRPALLCAQSLFKIHPDMDACFREIMERVPGALLHFVAMPERLGPITERFRARLRAAGIDVDTRVRFLPRMRLPAFLGWLRHADVVLDSWYFSGGDSSLATLAAGAPVVTHQGAFYRGRQTTGLLREIGVTETVASTPDAYIRIAETLATDPGRAEALRRQVAAGAAGVFGRMDGADALIDALVGPR